ncbi:Transposase [Beggiatoa sp. PS]|nr:Transposase [Beggiatoa sp. PS]
MEHLGLVAGVLKDLKIIEMIDERLGKYEGENLTAGEAVAGMIINGMRFSGKPLSLNPLFFENCPVELLFREGVDAADFNRFKLGRVLDRCYNYGTELLFSEIALNVCRQEKVETSFNSEDTTSFVVYGNYATDESNQTATDENNQTVTDESNQTAIDESNQTETGEAIIEVKHGYSKAHRPDLKQIMLEMMVSQDGGIPLMGKCFRSHASDNVVFKERSEKLIEQFKESETPRYLIADSKMVYREK